MLIKLPYVSCDSAAPWLSFKSIAPNVGVYRRYRNSRSENCQSCPMWKWQRPYSQDRLITAPNHGSVDGSRHCLLQVLTGMIKGGDKNPTCQHLGGVALFQFLHKAACLVEQDRWGRAPRRHYLPKGRMSWIESAGFLCSPPASGPPHR